ncbi:MAG TPA: hypothetical protein VI968_03585 [archaeon]|nr:hypothetical protein [archaeon]
MTLVIAAEAIDGTIVTVADAQKFQQGRVTDKGYFLEGISVRKVRPISGNAILGVSGNVVIVEDVFDYFQAIDRRCRKADGISGSIKRRFLSYKPLFVNLPNRYIFGVTGPDNSKLLATLLEKPNELNEVSCCSIGCYQQETSRLLTGYSSEMSAKDVRDFLVDAYDRIVLVDKKLGDRGVLRGRQICTFFYQDGFHELEFDDSGCTRSVFRAVA